MRVSSFFYIAVLLLVFVCLTSCEDKRLGEKETKVMTYKVEKTNAKFDYSDNWEQGQWSQTEALELTNHMGDKPEHFPETQAKVLYDDKNIYIFFKVQDQYVRSIANAHQGRVWRDSCVEFFFTPGEDISQGYFNVEANCGGFILLHHQRTYGEDVQVIDINDINKMAIKHSMPQIVNPEITDPTTWTLKYTIPLAIIEKYASIKKPRKGVKWKANFYKCADDASHPHWMTWSAVDKPKPNFHLPQYFGILQFN